MGKMSSPPPALHEAEKYLPKFHSPLFWRYVLEPWHGSPAQVFAGVQLYAKLRPGHELVIRTEGQLVSLARPESHLGAFMRASVAMCNRYDDADQDEVLRAAKWSFDVR